MNPLIPLAIVITGLVVTITLLRVRRRDILAAARTAIIDGLNDGVLVLDQFDRVIGLNPAAQRLIPVEVTRPVGQTLQHAWPALAAALPDQAPAAATPIEASLLTQSGPRIFDVRQTSLRDKTGQTTSRIVTLRDITDRKLQEAALQASEASYRGLFNSIDDAIYIQDQAGRFIAVNEGAVKMYGYPREYFIGAEPSILAAPDRNDQTAVLAHVQHAFAGEPQSFEFWGKRRNGEIFPKDVHLYPGTYFGQPVVVALATDITGRKATERRDRDQFLALQRQTARQAALLAASSAISSSLNLSTVLHRLAEEMGRAIDVTSTFILEWQPRTGTAIVLAEWISPTAAPHEALSDVGHIYRVVQEFGADLDRWLIPGQPITTQVTDANLQPGLRAHLIANDSQSTLKIPLVIKNQSIGYADLRESRSAREFTADEITLCQSIAQHAAIAIENARLYAHATQQAEHNAALIEVTHAINSTMHMPDLLGLIVDNVAALVQAKHGSLWLLDESGRRLSMQAMYNLPNVAFATQFALGEGLAGWAAHTGQSVNIDDVRLDPRYRFLPGNEHLRAMICAPLISRGQVIGVLSLDRYDDEPSFSDVEFRTVQDYAQQATLALTNARLMEAAQLQLDQFQAIYQLSDAVARAGSIDVIFQTALDTLLRTTHADRAAILLCDPDGVMRFKAWRGLSDRYRHHTEGHSPWPADAVDPQPVLVEDVDTEPSLAGLRPIIVGEGLRALGFIPLASQGQLLGKFMIYYNRPHHFTETQVAQTIAYHVAFAIVRLRAQAALRESEARFRELVESQGEGVSLIDPLETCRFANPAANAIFGVDNLIGHNLREFTAPEQFAHVRAQTDRRRRGERSTYDLEIVRPDGELRNLIVTATPQLDAAGSFAGALTVWLDITERKRAEEKIKASLLEKEVLLKEIHHRVKNNLQVVYSLLNLQSSQTTDAASLEVLRDSQNRVRSMALVHETLYRSPDLAQVDFAEYASSLAAHLARSYQIDSAAIRFSVQAASTVRLSIDVAVPCGLIINELVSNALKHAFPTGRGGTVNVRLAQSPDNLIAISVSDDGIGLPANFDYARTGSLGMQLVTQLVRQIRGCLTLRRENGTHFTLEFPAR